MNMLPDTKQTGRRVWMPSLFLALLLVVLPILVLTGCAAPVSVRSLTTSEIDSLKKRQLSAIFFQLRANIDGKPVSPLSPGDSNNTFRIYLAKLEGQEEPKQIRPASPTERTASEGWHYIMLPPGIYYMLLLPPGAEQNPPAVAYHAPSSRFGRLTRYEFQSGRGGFWSPEIRAYILAGTLPDDFRALEGFWFNVPKNKQVVYLGSLFTECKNGRGLGGLIDSCSEYEFINDSESAKQVAASVLPGLTFDTLPLVRYGKPREGTSLSEMGNINLVTHTPAISAAAFTGSELGRWNVIHGTGRTISAYNLLSVGLESARRGLAEKRAEERAIEIQPCIDRLSEEVRTIDFSSRFATALAEAAGLTGITVEPARESQTVSPGSSSHSRYRLTASLPMLRLRQVGQSNDLALELAVEIRLDSLDSGITHYYSKFYYSPELPIQNPLTPNSPLYARFISQQVSPHPISEWCGAGGASLLLEEIVDAIPKITAQVTQDLK